MRRVSGAGPSAPPKPPGDPHGDDPLTESLTAAGVTLTHCPESLPPEATFSGPMWLINGRRYDGSMGWGPPALRRLLPQRTLKGEAGTGR